MMAKKRSGRTIGMLLLLFVFISFFALQWKAKNVVRDFLARKVPSHLVLTYQDMEVNIFTGKINLEQVSLKIQNRDTSSTYAIFSTERIGLEGLGYWQLLFNNAIALNHLVLQQPVMNYYPYQYISLKNETREGVVHLLKSIEVDKIDIQDGRFYVMKASPDSIQFAINNYNLTIIGGRTNSELVTKKIPMEYDGYDLMANDIFADLGEFECLKINQLSATAKQLNAQDVYLESKYSKAQLSNHTNIERDFVMLQIPEVMVKELDFGFDQDRFGVAIGEVQIDSPKAEIYRDKLLPDDMENKPLYGKILRGASAGSSH